MLEQRNGVLFEQRRMEQRRMGQRNKVLFDLVLQLWIKTLGWPENKSFPGASYLQHEGLFPPGKQDTRSTIYVFVSYQKWIWSSLDASPCSPDGQMCYVGNLQVLRRSPIGQICLDGFLKKQWKVGEAPWIWSLDIGQSFVQKVVFFRGLRRKNQEIIWRLLLLIDSLSIFWSPDLLEIDRWGQAEDPRASSNLFQCICSLLLLARQQSCDNEVSIKNIDCGKAINKTDYLIIFKEFVQSTCFFHTEQICMCRKISKMITIAE